MKKHWPTESLLVHPPAATHVEKLSGQPTGLLRCQEDDHIGDVPWLADAPQGGVRRDSGFIRGCDISVLNRPVTYSSKPGANGQASCPYPGGGSVLTDILNPLYMFAAT